MGVFCSPLILALTEGLNGVNTVKQTKLIDGMACLDIM